MKSKGVMMAYGAKHQQLIVAYNVILESHGIDSERDTRIYKLLMKLDMKAEKGVTNALQQEMDKLARHQLATKHYDRVI